MIIASCLFTAIVFLMIGFAYGRRRLSPKEEKTKDIEKKNDVYEVHQSKHTIGSLYTPMVNGKYIIITSSGEARLSDDYTGILGTALGFIDENKAVEALKIYKANGYKRYSRKIEL